MKNHEALINSLESAFRPRITILSPEDREKMRDAIFSILEEIGMKVFHDGARRLLLDAGCPVEGEFIKIPVALLEKTIETAPGNIIIYDRNGNPAMDLGGDRAYFGTGSDLMYQADLENYGHRLSRLEDVNRAARLCDALPHIDYLMSCAYANELDAREANLQSFAAMVENSIKPMVVTSGGQKDLAAMWEVAAIVRDGDRELKDKPYFILYTEPSSPLKHSFDSLDRLLYCARQGIPAIYSPAPIAGGTAPMTIAGHLAQGLAESFFGLVVHQLAAPGAPFIMGVGPAVMDMATMQCSYNAPEYLMAYLGMIEMSQYFDLPNWGYAGTTDAQIPDGQASFEAGFLTYLSALSGSNLNHDLGYMNFGLTGSLELVTVMDEIIGQARRFLRGIPVNDHSLALEVIREAGKAGSFLGHAHTVTNLRKVQWRPTLFSRDSFNTWESKGSKDLMTRARDKMNALLEKHVPEPLAPEKAQAIKARVAEYTTLVQEGNK